MPFGSKALRLSWGLAHTSLTGPLLNYWDLIMRTRSGVDVWSDHLFFRNRFGNEGGLCPHSVAKGALLPLPRGGATLRFPPKHPKSAPSQKRPASGGVERQWMNYGQREIRAE